MNIYEKLQSMRVELQQKNIKKSGKNKFAGYEYYELSDILPPINELQAKHKTCSYISFNPDLAVLNIINSENPEEQITFTSPMAELTLKGGQAIQNLGGVETYQRRYLYMAAFEIVENDYFDATQGKDQQPNFKPKKAISSQTSAELNKLIKEYSELTSKPVGEISQELIKVVNKPLKDISEYEADTLLRYLNVSIAENKENG